MANRKPSGIRVNGVSIFVKDINATAGTLFENYVRVPGVGSITLPDEAAPQNDSIGVDGVVSAAGFAGVGTIAVPLPQVGQHPAHRFLEEKKGDKEPVTVKVRRPASKLFNVLAALLAGGVADAANGVSVVTVNTTAKQTVVKNKLLEGMLAAIAAADQDPGAFVGYKTAAPGADDVQFQTVVEVEDGGVSFKLAPGYAAANTIAAINLYVRQPGKQWDDIECTVGQMSPGDFQAASILAGNLVLIPTVALPQDEVVVTTSEE